MCNVFTVFCIYNMYSVFAVLCMYDMYDMFSMYNMFFVFYTYYTHYTQNKHVSKSGNITYKNRSPAAAKPLFIFYLLCYFAFLPTKSRKGLSLSFISFHALHSVKQLNAGTMSKSILKL